MKHASLFSGIGGFDLAAEWMGWENVFHCENNAFCKKILKYYWPKAISYDDIKTTNFTLHRGTIDILTGGFPCQPYSQAGKRLGKEDERHLWPEMLRAIREIQPRWVLGENVRGLINWSAGMVFHEVQAELEAEGYEVFPFLLPAAGINAPHERYRIWFVAYNTNTGFESLRSERQHTVYGSSIITDTNQSRTSSKAEFNQWEERKQGGVEFRDSIKSISEGGITTNTENTGQQTCFERSRQKQFRRGNIAMGTRQWDGFPTQSPVCNGDDGLSGRLDAITFSKWRNESIKGGGNAVVPQIPFEIFKAIEAYEKL